MNNCPNCGTKILADQTVCSCGELLRADATYHMHPWETETVFRPKAEVNWRRVAALAFSAILITSALVLSWPRLISSWKTNDQSETENVSQTSPPLTNPQSSDLIDPDNTNDSVTQQGVFDFTVGQRAAQTVNQKSPVRRATGGMVDKSTASTEDDSYDQQLLSDNSADKEKKADEKPVPDCKPDTSASLKRPEPIPDNVEPKPLSKQNGINYILGPRGGCFFVTAGGSKKYVDHSMCAAATTAASRQD